MNWNEAIQNLPKPPNENSGEARTQKGTMTKESPVFVIVYEDKDHPLEFFSGQGAEQAARNTLKERLQSWSCHLFVSAILIEQPAELIEKFKTREDALVKEVFQQRTSVEEMQPLLGKLKTENEQQAETIQQQAREIEGLRHLLQTIGNVCGFPSVENLEQLTDTINKKTLRLEQQLTTLKAECERLRNGAEQALNCLYEAGSNKKYDPSWIRPLTMTRTEVNQACINAYHILSAATQPTSETDGSKQ